MSDFEAQELANLKARKKTIEEKHAYALSRQDKALYRERADTYCALLEEIRQAIEEIERNKERGK